MNKLGTGENVLRLARIQHATGTEWAFGLSLVSVVAGLLLAFFSLSGVLLVVAGAAWFSWLDYRKRPNDQAIAELTQRIDAIQSKMNAIQVKVLG